MQVSVITPTYNRRTKFPATIECYLKQTFPLKSREWIIYEDGHESVADLLEEAKSRHPDFRYRYIRSDQKQTIGAKRNRLNAEAGGDIIVAWDDDDFYPPERIQHIVQKLQANPMIDLAGSSAMYIYFQSDASIYLSGPFGATHATNGTLAYRRRYAAKHRYDESVLFGEESSFLENYKHLMVQLDPRKSILCIAHDGNSYQKNGLRDQSKKTSLSLKDFVRRAEQRAAYVGMTA